MSEKITVALRTRVLSTERVELVLDEAEGFHRSWSKVYDGSLFLSMDAQSLGLLESVPDQIGSRPKYRLKRSGQVQPEHLARMGFVVHADANSPTD